MHRAQDGKLCISISFKSRRSIAVTVFLNSAGVIPGFTSLVRGVEEDDEKKATLFAMEAVVLLGATATAVALTKEDEPNEGIDNDSDSGELCLRRHLSS